MDSHYSASHGRRALVPYARGRLAGPAIRGAHAAPALRVGELLLDESKAEREPEMANARIVVVLVPTWGEGAAHVLVRHER